MNTYNSLYHNTLLRKHDKMREQFCKITNLAFGQVVKHQIEFSDKFKENLAKLFNNSDLEIYSSSPGYITVSSKIEFADPKYKFKREIATVILKDNKIHFRRKGMPNVTKVIKFGRELTPEKAVKYILRFGTK